MEKFLLFFLENIWIVEIFLGIAILLAIHFFFKSIVKYFRIHTVKENWIKHLDYILISPLKFLLIFVGIFFIVAIFARHLKFSGIDIYLNPFRDIGIILIFSWLFMRWKNVIFRLFFQRAKETRKFDVNSLEFLNKLFSVLIFFLSFLIILEVLGLNIAPLLAFGGIGAAAIGFAAKDFIANFVGGVMIYVARPFVKGDYIFLEGKSIVGFVESIGWYFTLIRDDDSCHVLVPNALFSSIVLQNQSRRTHRKVDEKFLLRKEDVQKLPILVKEINLFLEEEKNVDKDRPLLVYFDSFIGDSLSLKVKFYLNEIEEKKYFLIKQDLLLKIQNIFQIQKVEFSLPKSQVEIIKSKD